MSLQTLGNILLIVVLVGWICIRQLNWRPLVISQMWRVPALMAIIGVFILSRSGGTITSLDVGFLAVEIVLSLVVGALMGRVAQIRRIARAGDSDPIASPAASASYSAAGSFGTANDYRLDRSDRTGGSRPRATLETRTGWVGMALWIVLIVVRIGVDIYASSLGDKLATSTGIILILLGANRAARIAVLAYRLDHGARIAA